MRINPAVFWAPRVLCILFIGFVSMFALDVFQEGHGLWQTLLALVMHLIPTFVMLALLAAAWRWEWVGTVAFGICGAFFMHIVRASWRGKMVFAVPCFLAAGLFLVNWLQKRRHVGAAR